MSYTESKRKSDMTRMLEAVCTDSPKKLPFDHPGALEEAIRVTMDAGSPHNMEDTRIINFLINVILENRVSGGITDEVFESLLLRMTSMAERRKLADQIGQLMEEEANSRNNQPLIDVGTGEYSYAEGDIEVGAILMQGNMPAAKRMAELKALADGGNALATYNLAVDLMIHGGEEGKKEANVLCRRVQMDEAASPDIRARAMAFIGDSYLDGRGCERSIPKAQALFVESGDLGYASGAYNAALIFEGRVDGGRRDMNKAARYYEIAMRESVFAKTNLGIMHVAGMFSGSNKQKGKALLKEARNSGDATADEAMKMFELMGVL